MDTNAHIPLGVTWDLYSLNFLQVQTSLIIQRSHSPVMGRKSFGIKTSMEACLSCSSETLSKSHNFF
jgi:hypothetical protein